MAFFGEMPTAFPSSRLVKGTGSPGGRSLPYSWGERTHTSPSRETGSLSKRVEPRFLSRLHPLSRRYSSTSSSRTHSRRLGWNSSSPSWYSSGRTEPAVGLRGLLWAGGHLPLLSEPGHGLFGGDGVHHCHRPLGQKRLELGPQPPEGASLHL